MNKSNNLFKNTTVLGISNLFSKCLIFIMVPFFGRWLRTDEFGAFDLYYTYITLLAPLLCMACNQAVFRYLLDAGTESERKKIISSGVAITGSGLILASIGSMVFYLIGRQALIAPLLAVLLSQISNTFLLDSLRGSKRLSEYAVSTIIQCIAMSASVTVLVYFFHLGLAGILLGYAIGFLTSSLFAAIRLRFFSLVDLRMVKRSEIRNLLRYSLPLVPLSISWWIMDVSDRTIVSLFLGSTANGIYAMANKIPSICMVVFSVFHLSWQEDVSEVIGSSTACAYINGVFNKLVKTILTVCICVLSANFIFYDYIVDGRYGAGYGQVAILVTAVIFSFCSQFIGAIFIGMKQSRAIGASTVVAALIDIVIHLLLIKLIGLYAASVSTLASYIVLFIIRLIQVSRNFRIKLEKQNFLYIALYAYFVFAQCLNIKPLKFINLLIAFTAFFVVNHTLLTKLLSLAHIKQQT